jgi:hypothetical protein
MNVAICRGIALVHAVPAILLLVATPNWLVAGQWPRSLPEAPREQPHPAVVRVNVEEADAVAHGSGTLVDVRDQYGVVITNWHVVRDATGSISVVFPDGFRSAARVLRVDRDWDLAALLIWRPQVTPVSIASRAPQPGERLTIAGYGAGDYRSSSGRCTQYVAPSSRHPFEMVEVATSARQGDSGGPMLNASGELAGVLFGSGGGTTSGAYGGRVQQFLSTVWPPQADATQFQVASVPQRREAHDNSQLTSQRQKPLDLQTLPAIDHSLARRDTSSLAPLPAPPRSDSATSGSADDAQHASPDQLANVEPAPAHGTAVGWEDMAGNSLLQQGKTFLAILGLFSLIAHFSRMLVRSPE